MIVTLIFATIQRKYCYASTIWLIELPQPTILKLMAKLKFQIEKSSPFWRRQCTLTNEIGMLPYRMIYEKIYHLLVELEHKAFWAIKQCNLDYDVLGLQGSCNYKSWKRYKMMPTRMQGFTKKRPRVFMTKWLQKRSFILETKSFFIIHVWNFFLESCAIVGLDPLLFLMFFLWCS